MAKISWTYSSVVGNDVDKISLQLDPDVNSIIILHFVQEFLSVVGSR